jgi:hypothetical protein
MRKEFFKLLSGVILTASLFGGAVAQPVSAYDDKKKKETTQIVVVDKKDGNKSGGGQSQKPRPRRS